MLCEWAKATFADVPSIITLADEGPSLFEVFVDKTPGTAQPAKDSKEEVENKETEGKEADQKKDNRSIVTKERRIEETKGDPKGDPKEGIAKEGKK